MIDKPINIWYTITRKPRKHSEFFVKRLGVEVALENAIKLAAKGARLKKSRISQAKGQGEQY